MAVWRDRRADLGLALMSRRFPPPWSVDEADSKLDRRCFIVRDANGQALAYVYCGAAAKLLTRDEARRIAANIAKLPDLLGRRAPVEEQRRLYGAAACQVTAHEDGRGDDDGSQRTPGLPADNRRCWRAIGHGTPCVDDIAAS
jgi:hypothetical protein